MFDANLKVSVSRYAQSRAGEFVCIRNGCRKTGAEKTKPQETAISWGSAAIAGGDGGIRTLDPGFGPDAPLAGECLRPLGHVSQTFGRAGSQRDEAKIIAARTAKVNVLGTFFVPDSSSTTQFIHIGRKECTKEGTKRKHQANARNKCTRRTGHSGRSCTPRFLKQITPDPVRTPYAARARRAPCISRRSAPKS